MIKKMNIFIKLIILSGIVFFSLATTVNICSSVTMSEYSATPPFMASTIPPAVLILLDNSGSMNEFAYKSGSSPYSDFNPATTYYGYFDSTKKYSYATTAGGHFYQDAAGGWNGNFLNWLTMRRIDVVKKVLVGGKATPRSGGTPNYLSVDSSDRDYYKKYAVASTYAPFSGTRCFRIGVSPQTNIEVSTSTTGSCSSFTAGTYNIKVKYSDTTEPLGVVQATWEKVRYGLMTFNSYGAKYEDNSMRDGAQVLDNILSSPGVNVNLRTHIENLTPETWTPLGESLYEATRYFRALMSAYGGGNYAAQDPVTVACQPNFVIILTDGESTKDRNIPGTYFSGYGSAITDPQGLNIKTWIDKIATNEGYTSQWNVNANTMGGTYYLEGVSYWSHTTDLRDGTGGTPNTSGTQTMTTYAVFAFDDSAVGRDLLKKTAKYGGFKDKDGNAKPYTDATCGTASPDSRCKEWDDDGNGIPDTYYEASEGAALESALTSAITDILKRVASGTSVSILTTSASGAGNIYQSYYLPSKTVNNNDITWLGYLLQLGVKETGELLDNAGQTITYSFDESVGQTYVNTSGGGSTLLSEWTGYKWEAGNNLLTKTPASRAIKTFIDANKNGVVDSGEFIDFVDTNKISLRPYLRAATDTESADIINFIRGSSISGYRDRTCCGTGTNQYKLGDIAHSTPTVVSLPAENYGVIYGDKTYSAFFDSNKNRSTAVYIGANDGMLHAFDSTTGNELWSFIPQNLLPHLKWLTDPNYSHVYYVDLRAKATDINFGDTTTPNWKTVLIGGMRLGGGQITVTDTFGTLSFQSSYFAIDITNPSSPNLLWEFTDANLGFTTSYPAIAKVGNEWFAIFGSGPQSAYIPNYNGESTQTGKIFILNARNTGAWTSGTTFWMKDTGIANSFMGDPLTVDIDFQNNNAVIDNTTNYNTEVAYIGMTYKSGTEWKGKLYRLVLPNLSNGKGETVPTNWTLYTLFDGGAFDSPTKATPITTSPTATTDELGNLWVYFGTGRFYSTGDKSTQTQHVFLGIRDSYWDGTKSQWKPCWDGSTWSTDTRCRPTTPADMITDTSKLYNAADVSTVVEGGSGTVVNSTLYGSNVPWNDFVNSVSTNQNIRGWYTYLAAGSSDAGAERVITKPSVIGGNLLFTTFIPKTDVCSYGGTSNLYSLYYKTGTAYKESTLETPLTDAQKAAGATRTVAKSISLGFGMASSPAIHVGQEEGAKAFIQKATGEIMEINYAPETPKSGVISWKEL